MTNLTNSRLVLAPNRMFRLCRLCTQLVLCMILLACCLAQDLDDDEGFNRDRIYVRNMDLMYAYDSNKGLPSGILNTLLELRSKRKQQLPSVMGLDTLDIISTRYDQLHHRFHRPTTRRPPLGQRSRGRPPLMVRGSLLELRQKLKDLIEKGKR